MPLFAPEYLFHPEGWLQHHILETDSEGYITALRKRSAHDQPEELPGYLIPGLVNAHCHLELSHLQGQIPPEKGMAHFVREVFRLRNAYSEEQQVAAMYRSFNQLIEFGVVAVGDICNTDLSVLVKKAKKEIFFHNFLELPGLDPARTERVWSHGESLKMAFSDLPHSFTPHAPYSMSLPLLKQVYEHTRHISVHLLESRAEVELFAAREGSLADAFHDFGIVFPAFPDQHPIDYILRHLHPQTRAIWVHGILLKEQEVLRLMKKAPDSYFCLCPRSNRYLHDRSPDLRAFKEVRHRVCLGTDSLASNTDLDLWKEVQEIMTLPDAPDFHTVVSWATMNGADALGIGKKLGKLRVGLKPGLLWVRSLWSEKVSRIC